MVLRKRGARLEKAAEPRCDSGHVISDQCERLNPHRRPDGSLVPPRAAEAPLGFLKVTRVNLVNHTTAEVISDFSSLPSISSSSSLVHLCQLRTSQ